MSEIEKERIAARIKARQVARDELARLERVAQELGSEAVEQFWDEVAKRLPAIVRQLMPPRGIVPMSDAEAAKFGLTKIPFGQEKGKAVAVADLAWCDWLVGQDRDTFVVQLERYLARPDVAVRVEQALAQRKRQPAARRRS